MEDTGEVAVRGPEEPVVTAAIVGLRRPEQLDGVIGAANFS
jgi:hypothetical protein